MLLPAMFRGWPASVWLGLQPVSGPDAGAPRSAPPVAVVAPVEIEGTLAPHAMGRLHEALRSGLERAKLRLTPLPTTGPPCVDSDCVRARALSAGAQFVAQARVAVQDRIYRITIELVDAERGVRVASAAEVCSLCGLAEVEVVVRRLAAALAAKLGKLQLAPARIAVVSTPTGAAVFIDGRRVGVTPVTVPLAAGPHTLALQREGYAAVDSEIIAVRGVREHRAFSLAKLAPPPRSRAPMWLGGWSVLAVGAATVPAGIVFLALDEKPYRAMCSGADRDIDGDCRQRFDSLGLGVALTVVGGLAIATGAVLVGLGRPRGRSARAPQVTLGPRGFTVRARF